MHGAENCVTAVPKQVIRACVDKKMALVEVEIGDWLCT